jgi:hypothetical protein
LQVDGERDKVLLNAIVEGTLDRAAVGIGSFDQTPARSSKLRYLTLQSVDNVLQLLARASVRHRLTVFGVTGSILRPRRVAVIR